MTTVALSGAFLFFFSSRFLATMAKFIAFFLSSIRSRNSLVCSDTSAGTHARQGLVWLRVMRVLGDGLIWGLAPSSAV